MRKITYTAAKTLFSLLVIGSLIGTTSCNELTDLAPINSPSETVAFSTPSLCELSTTGLYDAAQSGYYAGGTVRGYPFGAANVEQGDTRGEDVINLQAFYRITYENTFDPTTANNNYMFFTLYSLINKCNLVIEGVKDAAAKNVITAEVAGNYEGEARFLRALAHHELLIHFARPYKHTPDASHPGVIYREMPIRTPDAIATNLPLKRNTVKECYDKIVTDLNEAEKLLPVRDMNDSKHITRATKYAAIALKTRIYQHTWNSPKVIEEANKLITANFYSLTESPDGPFANNSANKESIFSIQNNADDNGGVNGALASQYLRRKLVAVSPNLWRMPWWTKNDKRRSLLYISDAVGMLSNKYRDQVNYTDYCPIIRYAEVLLNLSEAYARENDMPNALTYLNMVRNRAVDPADRFTDASFADQNAMITAIIQERRIEFAMEGRRWADITRLIADTTPGISTNGIPAKVAPGDAGKLSVYEPSPWAPYSGALKIIAIPYSEFRFVWPIPQDEINANPNFAQNEGW